MVDRGGEANGLESTGPEERSIRAQYNRCQTLDCDLG